MDPWLSPWMTQGLAPTYSVVYVSGVLLIEQPEAGQDLSAHSGRLLLCTRGVCLHPDLLDQMPRHARKCVLPGVSRSRLTGQKLRRYLRWLSGCVDTMLLRSTWTPTGLQASACTLAAVKLAIAQRAVQALGELAGASVSCTRLVVVMPGP